MDNIPGSGLVETATLAGPGNNQLDYGAFSDTLPSTETHSLSSSESEAVGALIRNEHAVYNAKCVFRSDSYDSAEGSATIFNEVLNLVKNIVGSGGLSLPAGIASFANKSPSALIPSTILIFAMGIVNAYSFSLLGRICSVTKSKSYATAWERTMGRRFPSSNTTIWVNLVVIGKTVLGNWSFSIIIASTCQPLLEALTGLNLSKTSVLLWVTCIILLPLCVADKLQSLALFSFFGQLGTGFAALTMLVRYLDGSYEPGGKFYDQIATEYQPSFGSDRGALAFFTQPQSLVLISILSTGYVAHYNAPKYYYELSEHTTGRFNVVINWSFLLSALTYTTISSLGFATFGSNSAGFILDNYATADSLATLARLGIAVSVTFSYPLLFIGGRDGWMDFIGISTRTSSTSGVSRWRRVLWRYITSIVLLGSLTTLAIFVPDLTFVLSFGGATLACSIIYIFPALMFRALILNCTCLQTASSCTELKVAMVMLYVGILLGVSGSIMTVWRTFF